MAIIKGGSGVAIDSTMGANVTWEIEPFPEENYSVITIDIEYFVSSVIRNSWVYKIGGRVKENGKYLSVIKEEYPESFCPYTAYPPETTNVYTGSFKIPHNPDGSKEFTFEIETTQSSYGGGEWDYTTTFPETTRTLEKFNSFEPIVTSASNFNDEENVTMNYKIPSAVNPIKSLQACISFDGAEETIKYRDISTSGTSYTFNFTDAEREVMRAKVVEGNSKKIFFIIKTVFTGFDDDIYYSKLEKTFTVINNTPTLNPSVYDTSEQTLALTGDRDTIIKYCSDVAYTIGAGAYKGATVAYQQAKCAGKFNIAPTGTIEDVESGQFLFTVRDSRGNIASHIIEKNFIDYVKLTCNFNVDALTTDGNLSFTINGNYYNGSFGAVNNTFTLEYRYTDNEGNYSEWIPLQATIENNTYKTDTITFTGLNYQTSYTLQARAADKLFTIETEKEIKSTPVYDWSETDFNFNVPVTYTEENESYSISEAAKKMANIDTDNLTQLAGVAKAFGNKYELSYEISLGLNYDEVELELFLFGNVINGYIKAHRTSLSGVGNVNNEIVCGITFDSEKRVTDIGATTFISGKEGALASFEIDDNRVYPNDGSVSPNWVGMGSFNIYLTATDASNDTWSGHFTIPCILDFSKYLEE